MKMVRIQPWRRAEESVKNQGGDCIEPIDPL
jgi:hypothetical protein